MRRILHILLLVFITQWSWAQQSNDLALAKSYYNQEEYDKALTYIESAEKVEVSLELYDLKKDCYLALGDLDEAANWIKKNLKKRRFNPVSLHIDLMQVYRSAQDEKAFEKAFEDLQSTIYKNPNYAYAAGNDLQRRGFAQQALDVYERAEEIRPGFNFKYQKAVLYGELGNVRKMYDMYADLLEVSPNYLNSIKQILGRNYQNTESLPEGEYLKELLIKRIQAGSSNTLNQLLIFIFIQEEAYSQAFVQLRSLDKRGLLGKSELFKLARIAAENKDFFTAKRILAYEVEKGKEHPFYEDALALQLSVENSVLKEKNDATVQDWEALQLEYERVRGILFGWPEAGKLAIDEAFILCFELNQAERAQALLKETINNGTTSRETVAEAKIQLADILLYRGNRWDAILYYGQAEKAFEFSPIGQEAKFKRAKAAYYVGDFDWAQGIFSALKESTSKLIANDAMRYSLLITDNVALDTNTEAMEMYAKADLLQYQNKLDSSLSILALMEIAFIDHPIQDNVLMLEAEIFERTKNYIEAEKRYWTLIEEQKESILIDDALYALSQLYEGPLADKEKAMNCYERIFTKHQDGFFAADARKRFRELRGDVLN